MVVDQGFAKQAGRAVAVRGDHVAVRLLSREQRSGHEQAHRDERCPLSPRDQIRISTLPLARSPWMKASLFALRICSVR